MAADTELTPTKYIDHHLTHMTVQVREGAFWTLHIDTLVTSIILGILGLGCVWLVVRKATPGVPSKRQAFVELMIEFIDNEVKNTFHGNRHVFVAPTALTLETQTRPELEVARASLGVSSMAYKQMKCRRLREWQSLRLLTPQSALVAAPGDVLYRVPGGCAACGRDTSEAEAQTCVF